jgi:hypothetical protein
MESDYKEISQVELPKSIMAETMGDAILNYYEIPFFPDRFEDEGFDVIEWMHSPKSIFSIKIRQNDGGIFWSGLHEGKTICGIGFPSDEAWDMIYAIVSRGLVNKTKNVGE